MATQIVMQHTGDSRHRFANLRLLGVGLSRQPVAQLSAAAELRLLADPP
jgi:hypothetical protein